MTGRWAVVALYLLLVAAFAAGIWATYRATFPGSGLHRLTGVFEARWGDTGILVKHDAVPGVMEEMDSMALLVESRAMLDRAELRRGDRVRMTVRQAADGLLVVDIRKIR